MNQTPVLLVHGSFHDHRCWDPISRLLARDGIPVRAIDLPGRGQHADLLPRFDRDVAVVEEELDALERPTVVVAHGRGGQVITRLGSHPLVEQLVYLAAPMPDKDERASELIGRVLNDNPLTGGLTFDGTSLRVDPAVAAELFYPGCSPSQIANGLTYLVPEPLDPADAQAEPEADRCGDPAWRHHASTFLLATGDVVFPRAFQEQMAERAERTMVLDAGHASFLSHAHEIAVILHALAARA
jgi:pimeloyl-ACP methyl ester carboxylesterase